MYRYYWNRVPNSKPQRNNLIYTSLISDDNSVFVQWYYNDGVYHGGQNEVVDPSKMQEKFEREIYYLGVMHQAYPEHVPAYEIDFKSKKVFLNIDKEDFWNAAECDSAKFNQICPDWENQALDIIQSHKDLGLYKFSMHPSSFFLIDGKLKSINYFFCYHETEGPIKISDHASHIHSNRQNIMKQQVETQGIQWDSPEPLVKLQNLCFDSFRTNYPATFIDKAKEIYND